jgi:hypothetical protein
MAIEPVPVTGEVATVKLAFTVPCNVNDSVPLAVEKES